MKAHKQIAQTLLHRWAKDRRRVFADWRLLIECRRIAAEEGTPLPGWEYAFEVLRELKRSHQAIEEPGCAGVYKVDVPYAQIIPVTEEQLVQEANPFAVFSHLTALSHHGLTEQIPVAIQATQYSPPDPLRIPLGTAPEEWVDLPDLSTTQPRKVGGIPIHWTVTKGEWDFGHTIHHVQGLPIYVTDVERTLIDLLRSPKDSGGSLVVFRAWKRAKDSLDADRLTAHVERFGQAVLKQRVGYLMETLGIAHPRLQSWKLHKQRGGSLKLVPSESYSPVFSSEWNLSLNVASSVLEELRDE